MLITSIFNDFQWSRGGSTPDPYVTLSVAKISHNSNIVYRTDSPVFEQGFTFLVSNPETDTLHIKVRYYHERKLLFLMLEIIYRMNQKSHTL